MSINNLNNSTVLEEPEVLEDLLNVTGDPGPEPTLPSHVASFLGEQLKAFHAHLMSEPVPERFVQLLDQLDRKENGYNGE